MFLGLVAIIHAMVTLFNEKKFAKFSQSIQILKEALKMQISQFFKVILAKFLWNFPNCSRTSSRNSVRHELWLSNDYRRSKKVTSNNEHHKFAQIIFFWFPRNFTKVSKIFWRHHSSAPTKLFKATGNLTKNGQLKFFLKHNKILSTQRTGKRQTVCFFWKV